MLRDIIFASIALLLLIAMVRASTSEDVLSLYDSVNSLRNDLDEKPSREEVREIVREEMGNVEMGSPPVVPMLLYGLVGISLVFSMSGLFLVLKPGRSKKVDHSQTQEFESLVSYFSRNLDKSPSSLRQIATHGGWKKDQIEMALNLARKR